MVEVSIPMTIVEIESEHAPFLAVCGPLPSAVRNQVTSPVFLQHSGATRAEVIAGMQQQLEDYVGLYGLKSIETIALRYYRC